MFPRVQWGCSSAVLLTPSWPLSTFTCCRKHHRKLTTSISRRSTDVPTRCEDYTRYSIITVPRTAVYSTGVRRVRACR